MQMYNVMIVEDELMVRIGIKNSVKWDEFDMKVAAEAPKTERTAMSISSSTGPRSLSPTSA